jgi:hypothetical protein
MKYTALLVVAFVALSSLASAQTTRVPVGAMLFIEPTDVSQALSAAILKKKVPVRLTVDREKASYVLTSVSEAQTEKTGERVAKVIMLGMFAGNGKSRDTSVSIVDADGAVLWAYTTRIPGLQSAAEGVAKHLKQHITSEK